MFAREGGTSLSVRQVIDEVLDSATEGLSLLGGEPFEQAEACAELAQAVRAAGHSVMVFTGYRLEEVLLFPCSLRVICWSTVGTNERCPTTRVGSIGSTNQRLHFLHRPLPPRRSLLHRGQRGRVAPHPRRALGARLAGRRRTGREMIAAVTSEEHELLGLVRALFEPQQHPMVAPLVRTARPLRPGVGRTSMRVLQDTPWPKASSAGSPETWPARAA